MRPFISVFFVASSALSSSVEATPWGLPGEAVIDSDKGKMFICIPKAAQNSVRIDSIWVSEKSLREGGRKPMWEIELAQNGTPIHLEPGGCVSYGFLPPGYHEQVAPKALRPGDTYYARMNLIVANPVRHSILFYDAVFCVGQQREGFFNYRQYQYEPDGRTVKAAC
jgi:hypothetical protein